MNNRRLVFWSMAVIALALTVYSFSGVVMNTHFALATENAGYARAAVLWALAALTSLAAAIALARAAWKYGRRC